ncbi:MAG: hypothetical protein LRS49_06380 [Desulfurococcales archaeon]|nr:hypothetical protein [Desulfurococcales archaeon]
MAGVRLPDPLGLLLGRWGRISVETPPLDPSPRLHVEALGASVEARLTNTPGQPLRVEGRGRARVVVAEKPGVGLEARVRLSGQATLSGPAAELHVDARGSSLDAEASGLRGLALELRASSARVRAGLAPGATLRVRGLASAAAIRLDPRAPGEYEVEVEASASSIKVEAPPEAAYIVEGPRPPSLSVRSGQPDPASARYVIRVKARLQGATLALT